jgi:hypothetical protein
VEVTRARFGSVLEWFVATAFIVAVLGAAAFLLGEVRTIKAVTPVIAGGAPIPDPPASLPAGSVSVPMLVLSGGAEIHVGERAAGAAAKLMPSWRSRTDVIERVGPRERVVRAYDDGARRFVIVAESSNTDDEARVAAIYLH